MDPSEEKERSDKLLWLSEQFNDVLSPLEPTIMKLQSLLVWEKPIKSAIMFAAVHCIFWVFFYGGCRFYSTLSTVLMVVFFLYTWKKKIWPEIRVPPKSPESDDWTPVHPRLLSVPELCQHLAVLWCYMIHCVHYWTSLRQDRPLKFCIETSFICVSLAMVGHYISGGMLSYIIIMSIIMWPCLQYHNLLKKIYMRFEPIFMKLDYSIKVKNKWRYEGDRAPISTNENTDEEGKLTTSVCADNESDLEDFYPSDPMLSAQLARAITDSEDEGGSSSIPVSPRISKEPSNTNSDEDQFADEPEIDDEFGLSIDMMPSFEETLDHTDDELLDLPSMPSIVPSRESSEESMRFNPTHFDDSDDGYHGDQTVPRKSAARTGSTKRRAEPVPEIDTGAVARDIVAKAFSSVMGSVIQNSVLGSLQNMAAAGNSAGNSGKNQQSQKRLAKKQAAVDRIATTYSDSDDDYDDDEDVTVGTSDHGRRDDLVDSSMISEDSASLNIEDEFDFLDEYEDGSSAEKK